MKYLISIILIFIFYTSLSDSVCTSDKWKVIPHLDHTRILGRWYIYKTFAEGHTDCIWYDLNKHLTKKDTVLSSISILFKNGTSNSKVTTSADITLFDQTKPEGKIKVAMQNGAVAVKHITAADYDEFAIVRSCMDSVEFIAIYVRSLHPSDATVEKINKILEEHGIDQTQLITACAGLHDSEIV